MKIAVTGATGFVGRELVRQLCSDGHELKCWKRKNSDTSPLDDLSEQIEWVEGGLAEQGACESLVQGCDKVVHSALWRPGENFRGGEGDVVEFSRVNILGTLELIEVAISAGVSRFVFVSTCAVHERILDDRKLDEAHPLWTLSHYGAHKAALEKFVHSYGFGFGYPICAIRPTGIYGIANPISSSKWFGIVERVLRGKDVTVDGGGKEVHVADVAKGVRLLLSADGVTGEAYACYDRYVSEHEVAKIAVEVAGSDSKISGEPKQPKHQIDTQKIRVLGMDFGGESLLRETIEKLVNEVRASRET